MKAMTGPVLGLALVLIVKMPVRAEGSKPPQAKTDAEVARLVDHLKSRTVKRSKEKTWDRLYLLDLNKRDVTLIVEQPTEAAVHCGSPDWSKDGKRIFFDGHPGSNFHLSRMQTLSVVDNKLDLFELGPGNCPNISPDSEQFAFLLNSGGIPGAQSGVWAMNADGSGSHRVGGYGRPKWSPDSRQFLVVGFGTPTAEVSLMDAKTGDERPITLANNKKFCLVPSWTAVDTIVSAIGAEIGDAVAFVDVSEPQQAKVKEVLWEKKEGIDFTASYPVYSERTGRCVFVGAGPKGKALYSVERGKNASAKRLEPEGFDNSITDLALSPDGRYLLFCSDRPDRRKP